MSLDRHWRLLSTACSILVLLGTAIALPAQDAPVDSAAAAWLQPGDAIRVRIWREPDLSGEFTVDENGEVVLPRLGPVRVSGVAPDSLQQMLITAYSVDLRNPSIEITMLRRVQVLGAVVRPGLYQLDPTMRIADAVALAGGPTSDGKKDRVQLMRGDQTVAADLSTTASVASARVRSGDRLFVPLRSWVSRNPGILAAATTATGLILASFLRR